MYRLATFHIATLFLLTAIPTSAFADNPPKVFTKNSERLVKGATPLPIVLQLGIDAGLLNHKTTIPREGPFNGSFISGKIIASLLFENWIIESGLGWSYLALYGTTQGENPTDLELGHRVYTQSAFAEGSLRFRLTPEFHLGLIVQDYFGTDLSLSQRKDTVTNMLLGGGMIAFDLLNEAGIFRIGGQILAEIIDNHRQIVYYGATLQFGIPLKNYDTLLRRTDVLVKQERIQKVEIPKIINRSVIRDVTKFSLPLSSFKFVHSQGTLLQEDQTTASELGETLKLQQQNFKQVTIEASVKASGDPKRDLILSEARAQSIRNAIVSLGLLPINRVLAKGLGGRSLVDDAGQPTSNTTLIDLSFTGLSNPEAVSSALNLFLRRRSTPETCRGDKCK